MAKQKRKSDKTGKSRSKKLSVKKKLLKDLDVPKGKGPKGGLTTSLQSPLTTQPLNVTRDSFIKIESPQTRPFYGVE